jgi:predicted SAM-dependent methyltransferase
MRDSSLDFIAASHILEHMPDPIGALIAWWQALRPGGKLLLLVPDPATCPDRHRPVTTLEHLEWDHREPSTMRDLAHYREWARSWNGYIAEADVERRARALSAMGYAIHYHVFSGVTLDALMGYVCQQHGANWWAVERADEWAGVWQKVVPA